MQTKTAVYKNFNTHLNFKAQKRTLQFAFLVDLTHGLHKYTQGKIPIQHKNGYIGSLVYSGYFDIYLTLFGVDLIGSYIMEDFEYIFFCHFFKIDHIRQGS